MTLKELYYNPKSGYMSINKFYKKAKEQDPSVTFDEVKKFVERQEVYQLSKQAVRPKEYSTILANKIRDNYQIDIIVYDRYTIDKYKYILCVIDVHSRYASCRAVVSRYNNTIELNLISIFKEMGIPKNVNCDNEFNTSVLNRFFGDRGIKCHFSEVGEINKNAIVERFNRTLAGVLNKWRTATGNTSGTGCLVILSITIITRITEQLKQFRMTSGVERILINKQLDLSVITFRLETVLE